MVKGRNLITRRSDRFTGSGGSPELCEDEVWSMIDGTGSADTHSSSPAKWTSHASSEDRGKFAGHSQTRSLPAMTDHHRRRKAGGLSMAFDDSNGGGYNSSLPRIVHQLREPDGMSDSPLRWQLTGSAPVNVPDWSKIYRVETVESLHDCVEEANDDLELVPPHEYLARSRKMAANSVFEGVGRTLKGRDLSRVRDAVWSQTGFYG